MRQDGLNPDRDVVGQTVTAFRRRAKLIMMDLKGGSSVLFHLKMTGQLIFEDTAHRIIPGGHPIPSFSLPQPNRSTHAIFTFDNGSQLFFNDSRMFGFIRLIKTDKIGEVPFVAKLGPEPFDSRFTESLFSERLKKRPRMKIKVLLLDQTFLAGVGNIYANEALWEAKIHPLRLAMSLSDQEIRQLYRSVKHVLQVGIDNKGTTLSDFVDSEGNKGGHQSFLNAHNRANELCPRDDSGVITRIVVGGRGTFFCPVCQKEMK